MKISLNEVKAIPNLISQEDLKILKNFMGDIPERQTRKIEFKDDIENSTVQAILDNIRNKSYKAICEELLNPLGLSIKRIIFEERGQISGCSEGFCLDPHSDCPDFKFELPYFDLSTIMYVNDDYLGGEIVFDEYGYSYKPKSGELLIFPSYFVHATNPIKPLGDSVRVSVPGFWSFEVESI
jgi:hypothetical protein